MHHKNSSRTFTTKYIVKTDFFNAEINDKILIRVLISRKSFYKKKKATHFLISTCKK